eukprot:1287178-Alexandrium_andersonii.AAC.1
MAAPPGRGKLRNLCGIGLCCARTQPAPNPQRRTPSSASRSFEQLAAASSSALFGVGARARDPGQ